MTRITSKRNIFKLLILLASLLIISSFCAFYLSRPGIASPLLISGFVIISFAMAFNPTLKGYIYTLWILTSVILALSYPLQFQSFREFKLSRLITPMLQIIMFGMGSNMNLNNFTEVLKTPKGVFVGLISHYTLMPCIGFAIVKLFGFPPEIAVGIIIIACTPSGIASNVMVFLSKGNLALAITLTSLSTILSPVFTPLLIKLFAGHIVNVNVVEMMMEILKMVLLPIAAGLCFNLFFKKTTNLKSLLLQMCGFFFLIVLKNSISYFILTVNIRSSIIVFLWDTLIFFILPPLAGLFLRFLLNNDEVILKRILSLVSQIGLIIITIIIVANGYTSLLSLWGLLLLPAMLLQNCLGYFVGFMFCKLLNLNDLDRRAITFEVGMQNGGMASAVAVKLQEMEQKIQHEYNLDVTDLSLIGAGFAIPAAVFSPIQNITGSTLAMWFRNKPLKN